MGAAHLVTAAGDGALRVGRAPATESWFRARMVASAESKTVVATMPNIELLAAEVAAENWSPGAAAVVAASVSAWHGRQAGAAAPIPDERLTAGQQLGAGWLAASDGAILADEMGAGKTVQICAALQRVVPPTLMVVCPLSVAPSWQRHLREWAPAMGPAEVLPAGSAGRKHGEAISAALDGGISLIVPWSRLAAAAPASHWDGAGRNGGRPALHGRGIAEGAWSCVVVDEAHRAKNPAALQTRCLMSVRSERWWLATGTPAANSPEDLWALLRIVDRHSWPSLYQFIARWCETDPTPWEAKTTRWRPDRRRRLAAATSDRLLIRTMEDVLGRKFPHRRETVMVAETDQQRRVRRELKKHWRVKIGGDVMTAPNALSLLSALTTAAQAECDIVADPLPDWPGHVRLKMRMPSPKITALVDACAQMDEPVVVFSRSLQLARMAYEHLTAAGWSATLVTGGTGAGDRAAAAEGLLAGGRAALVATTQSMSEGVSLVGARITFHLSPTWSMIDYAQADARIRRPGQEAHETVSYDFLTAGTVDERIAAAVGAKRGLAGQVDWRAIAAAELADDS